MTTEESGKYFNQVTYLPGHQVVHVSPLDDPRHQIVVVSLLHVEIIVFFEGYTYYYFVVQGDTAP